MAPCLGVVISTGQMNKWKLVFQLVAAGTTIGGLAWVAVGLTLYTGIWSMLVLFRDNSDLWWREPLQMERR